MKEQNNKNEETDIEKYERLQQEQSFFWESLCLSCGACCGIDDGDYCEHLVNIEGKWRCDTYENRLGLHQTKGGKELECVPLRQIIHQSWPGDRKCEYKKQLKQNIF
jgi:uncharacterized cysteine cluster protein YcgN (CxxCxxCC family)